MTLSDTSAKASAHGEPAGGEASPGAADTRLQPVPFRGGGFRPVRVRFVGLLVFAVILVLWEAGSQSGVISNLVLPAPSEAFEAFRQLVETGQLWRHLGASLQRLIVGWTLGMSLGVAVGLMIGLFSLARAGLMPLVSALFPIPKIALLPLFVIWFGIGEGSKVATILFGSFFPTVIATSGGVDNVDRSLVRMGQSFGLSWWSIVRKIILPGAMPAILSGARISASIAIILLVAAEMIGAEYGVGAFILMAGSLFATDQLLAGVAILSAMGLIVGWLIGRAERWLLRWRS
ncbi:ABC transporter permease [Stappia stellulata]|uniref:ABC transporter permease n=1 Tax=Stappia stellulata TaxID=71235 RepID=UPI001CD6A526|nr:ABC transporter permease [Stappia stellulata]MCA1242338.1 ABC transporter permease [Stappia stellulata]